MKLLKVIPIAIVLTFTASALFAQKAAFPPNKINKIINFYLDIKNALIKDDGTTAKIKANELFQVLSDQPDRGLQWRQVKILGDNMETLLNTTKEMCYTVDEHELRQHFADMTPAVYNLVKQLRLYNRVLYRQYSPLSHAYWISETAAIKNPYCNYDYKPCAYDGYITEVLPKSVLAD